MSDKKSSGKKRNWAFVVYPTQQFLASIGSTYDGSDGWGSVPDDWRVRLQLSGLQYAISPLHDKDTLDDGSGRTKKPHWHVLVVYGSPTTFANVKRLTDSFNSPAPIPLEQVRGYYRYLTHKDNPDKAQYDESEIVTGGGFNIADFVEMSKSEVLDIEYKLQQLIRERDFVEYVVFMDYVQDNCDRLTYDVASSHTLFFNTYLRSRRHHREEEPTRFTVDVATGEVVPDT